VIVTPGSPVEVAFRPSKLLAFRTVVTEVSWAAPASSRTRMSHRQAPYRFTDVPVMGTVTVQRLVCAVTAEPNLGPVRGSTSLAEAYWPTKEDRTTTGRVCLAAPSRIVVGAFVITGLVAAAVTPPPAGARAGRAVPAVAGAAATATTATAATPAALKLRRPPRVGVLIADVPSRRARDRNLQTPPSPDDHGATRCGRATVRQRSVFGKAGQHQLALLIGRAPDTTGRRRPARVPEATTGRRPNEGRGRWLVPACGRP